MGPSGEAGARPAPPWPPAPPGRSGQLVLHWFVDNAGELRSRWFAEDTLIDPALFECDLEVTV